jgi:hypothetical protein
MNLIIKANLESLNKTKILLTNISDDIISNKTVSPYYSSIGSHIRHILDFYDCILKESDMLDLTARKRNLDVETNCKIALNYYCNIIKKIKALKEVDLDRIVNVNDDLGLGNTVIKCTFSGLLAQANSHTIHHYAIINYILEGLSIKIIDETFGYNPTTPKEDILN